MAIDKIFNDANVDGIADNIFGAVNNSVSEVKAMQQRKAAENVQMVVEAFKKIETNITEKFDNVTDVIEKRVLTIKDGRDGSSGSDGRNGRDGKPGRDGVNGKQGTPGTPGKDGVDGEDGVSVTNANIDFDGSLVISLSSGQQINVGEVVAPDLAEKIKIVSTMSTNGAVGIKDEGTSITAGVKIINFVGATVTATNSGDDVTVNVSAGTGTVTSVAATVPAFLSVAGSPVTTTGTLAISLSGTALPVANGGTSLTTLTANNVILGNGASAPTFVAPSTSGNVLTSNGTTWSSTAPATSGTVTSVAMTVPSILSISGSPITSSGTLALTYSGTALPVANGGTGITSFGTGVATALGVNTGSAGAFVVNGGALGTPSSGTVTNLTGTASININGTVGATTATTGAFSTVTATGTISGGTSGTAYSFSGSAPATSLTLDASGNLVVGATSSSSQAFRVSQTAFPAVPSGFYCSAGDGAGAYQYGITRVDATNGRGFQFLSSLGAGNLPFYSISVGTAASTIAGMTFSEALRIDSSGNLGIGTTTPDIFSRGYGRIVGINDSGSSGAALEINSASSYPAIELGRGGVRKAFFTAQSTVTEFGNLEAVPLAFFTNSTERARIDSSGDFYVGTTTGTIGTGNFGAVISQTGGIFASRNEDGSVVIAQFGGNVGLLRILGNGNAQNTNNSYGAISDVKLKENIVDASPKLADLMQVKVRNYNLIGDAAKQLGVVAQELETVFPAMVEEILDKDAEGNDLGTATKAVKYSVFVPMLIKAMQEQQALITQLTARITALETA